MKKLGGALFFFGVGSIVLYFLNMQFVILAWVDLWGPKIGWVIRILMAVIGGLMWLMAPKEQAEAA